MPQLDQIDLEVFRAVPSSILLGIGRLTGLKETGLIDVLGVHLPVIVGSAHGLGGGCAGIMGFRTLSFAGFL